MITHVSGQRTIISSDPTLHDKFGKRIGNLMFSSTTLKFGRVKNNVVQHDTIRIFNYGAVVLNLATGKIPAHLTVSLQSGSIAPKSESWIAVAFDAPKKNDYGFVLDRFELLTNDSLQPKKTINVTADIREAFAVLNADDSVNSPKSRWNESVFDFGKIKQGDKITREFVVYNDGKKDLLIRKVKGNCNCIKTNVSKSTVVPGDSSTLKIDFDSAGRQGKDSRKIDVYLNDFLNPDKTLEVKGEVVK